MEKNKIAALEDNSSKGEEVFNPSEQLENLINHYKNLENQAENILVAVQYLEGAKKEIEREILEIVVNEPEIVE